MGFILTRMGFLYPTKENTKEITVFKLLFFAYCLANRSTLVRLITEPIMGFGYLFIMAIKLAQNYLQAE